MIFTLFTSYRSCEDEENKKEGKQTEVMLTEEEDKGKTVDCYKFF